MATCASQCRLNQPLKERTGRRAAERSSGYQNYLDHGCMGAFASPPIDLGLGVGQQVLQQDFPVICGARSDQADGVGVVQDNGQLRIS